MRQNELTSSGSPRVVVIHPQVRRVARHETEEQPGERPPAQRTYLLPRAFSGSNRQRTSALLARLRKLSAIRVNLAPPRGADAPRYHEAVKSPPVVRTRSRLDQVRRRAADHAADRAKHQLDDILIPGQIASGVRRCGQSRNTAN